MKWNQVIAVLILAVLSLVSIAGAVPNRLMLKPNEIHVLDFEAALKSVDPSSRSISVESQGESRLRITSSKPGTYSLSYALTDGRKGTVEVIVSDGEPNELMGIKYAMERDLGDIIGIDDVSINPYLEVIEVRGAVVAFGDWQEFRRILVSANERWPNKVKSSVKFEPDLKPMNSRLQEMLSANVGIADAKVTVLNEMGDIKVILNGSAFSDDDRKLAEDMVIGTLARFGLPDVSIVNRIRKSDALVEVEFTYFRLSDKISDELGMDLLNEINMGLIAGANWANDSKPSYTAAFSLDMDKVFQMLKSSGLASASRKQTITVENGSNGNASFGGEQIIRPRVTNSGTQADVTRIPFGFIIDVTPTLRGTKDVRLDINIENSNVEFDSESSDYTKLSSIAKSVMDVPINGMAVLAVNQTRAAAEGNSGTPFFRKIPGLKIIFGKERQESTTWYEGFIAVPRIQGRISETEERSISERTDEVLRKIEKKLDQA